MYIYVYICIYMYKYVCVYPPIPAMARGSASGQRGCETTNNQQRATNNSRRRRRSSSSQCAKRGQELPRAGNLCFLTRVSEGAFHKRPMSLHRLLQAMLRDRLKLHHETWFWNFLQAAVPCGTFGNCVVTPQLRFHSFPTKNAYNIIPLVPHKAVAEVSKIGNL